MFNLSEGSPSEIDDLLRCSHDLGDLSSAALEPLAEEVDQISRMLSTLRRKVEREP